MGWPMVLETARLGGSCCCGEVRYELRSTPFDVGYCHCRTCQLISGSPVMAYGTVLRRDFHVAKGVIAVRRSSSFAERGFCRQCGTPLVMRLDFQPETIDLTIVTLDNPECVVPEFHIWDRSRLPWFEIDDTLPRHDRFRPDMPGLPAAAANGTDVS
jgi:hypothetical protein